LRSRHTDQYLRNKTYTSDMLRHGYWIAPWLIGATIIRRRPNGIAFIRRPLSGLIVVLAVSGLVV